MKPSTTSTKKTKPSAASTKKRLKSILFQIIAIAFWILIWEALALRINSELIIASPTAVADKLREMIFQPEAYKTLLGSLIRISAGFLAAFLIGAVLAAAAAKFRAVKALLSPIIRVIKSTPVASFIILAIIWFGSGNLSIFISFLMVLPVIYLNLLEGIESQDKGLTEMAAVYRMPARRKLFYILMPQLMPFVLSACSVALGLCWKSGVAAEVIGITGGSIGERLYRAKLYFETADLLAWTAVIIAVSALLEKAVMLILMRLAALPAAKFESKERLFPKESDFDFIGWTACSARSSPAADTAAPAHASEHSPFIYDTQKGSLVGEPTQPSGDNSIAPDSPTNHANSNPAESRSSAAAADSWSEATTAASVSSAAAPAHASHSASNPGGSRNTAAHPGNLSSSEAPNSASQSSAASPNSGILLDNITKSYGGRTVLQNLTLSISPGEHIAIMGHSGAGKTTLSRIICGLETPDSGSVHIGIPTATAEAAAPTHAADAATAPPSSPSISIVFQEDRLIEAISAIGNIIAVGGEKAAAYRLLCGFGFTDELIFKPAASLSGGEKRRCAIARALLFRSDIIIMDEPFKGIDQETLKASVLPHVKELTQGRTLILITHSEEEAAELCDRSLQL